MQHRSVRTLSDVGEVLLRADRPLAFEVDGDYLGETDTLRLTSVPAALRVVVP